jgi:hypothetical protein
MEAEMRTAPRISRAQAVAIPRPAVAVTYEWLMAAVVLALLLAGLLVP